MARHLSFVSPAPRRPSADDPGPGERVGDPGRRGAADLLRLQHRRVQHDVVPRVRPTRPLDAHQGHRLQQRLAPPQVTRDVT